GFIPLLVPKEVIARWLGDAAGFRGIVAGAAVGALSPGGPFLNFPILAGFYQAGAGVGPIAAFITSWSIFGLHRILLWELPLLGPRLTFARLLISVPMPFLVGVAARAVYVRWLT
ncbi:MAG: permease, partial [Armatimonadetes bacterium]|nr:permease [Armatimonadota bacterium]